MRTKPLLALTAAAVLCLAAVPSLRGGAVAGAADWQPIVEMGTEVYPSYALATATVKTWEGFPRVFAGETAFEGRDTTYVGDQLGMLGASVRTPHDGARVRVEIDAPEIAEPSSVEAVLTTAGRVVDIFPVVQYKWPRLAELRQPIPARVTFRVYIDGALAGEQTQTVRVRSVNDAPLQAAHRTGGTQDNPWMFAAYVNENDPAVDGVLREALGAGVVSDFAGYQADSADAVWQQVYAVWNVFQRRGVKYSSIDRASANSDSVVSQHVRTFGEALASSQANCVDGSVLFASVLRKIGLEPALVLRPGHMYLSFWLDEAHTQGGMLETTMLGSEDLTRYPDPGALGGLAQLVGSETKNDASWRSFNNAVAYATEAYQADSPHIQAREPGYAEIDIDAYRQLGVMPINK